MIWLRIRLARSLARRLDATSDALATPSMTIVLSEWTTDADSCLSFWSPVATRLGAGARSGRGAVLETRSEREAVLSAASECICTTLTGLGDRKSTRLNSSH